MAAAAVLICAVVLASVFLAGIPDLTAPARAATSPYFKLSVTPTQSLTSGTAMTVTVTRTAAGTADGLEIYAMATGWCTANFQPPANGGVYSLTLSYAAFPQHGISGSHCTTVTHPLQSTFETEVGYSPPKNSTGDYPTLNATVTAESSGGTTLWTGAVLVCDASHPCTFVVLVYVFKGGTATTSVFLSVPVTYLPTSINADCGGAAPGQLTTVGPDRLGQQITSWTLDACSAGLDGGKAVTQNLASGQSDASSLEGFSAGIDDLAYSSVGSGATAVFTSGTQRPYVAVPIALNAVVLAHVQAKHVASFAPTNVFGRYTQLYLTDAQAAQLIGGGPSVTALQWKSTLGKTLEFMNPTLASPSYYNAGPTESVTANPSNFDEDGVVGSSQTDGTTLFATTFFHTVAPRALVSATGHQLGVTSDFGTASPHYNIFVATGNLLLAKDLSPGLGQGWALTDAATAASTWGGLSVAALQTPGSIGSPTMTFVSPTVASMQAAVPEMIPQSDGTLEPNSDATAVNGVQAYPLTYVEYAIAPAQPLLNASCAPQSKAQQDLVDWLDYITGPGQAELEHGLAPLTPALQHQARQAIAEVGKTPPSGPCAPVTAPAPPKTSGSSGGSSSAGSTGATTSTAGTGSTGAQGSFTTSATFGGGSSPVGTPTPPKPSSRRPSGLREEAVDLSTFRHSLGSSLILPVLGVLVLIVFLPGLALLMADGSLRGRTEWLSQRRIRRRSPPSDES